MRGSLIAFALLGSGIVAACSTVPITGDPAAEVFAKAETVPVGTTNADAADDPAIWRNPADPGASLIVGTDKKAGLHVYSLDGSQKSFLDAGLLNNVDLVQLGDGTILVAASDRTDPSTAHILIATLDPATGVLTETGRYAVGAGEGYGICMSAPDAEGRFTVFSPVKEGALYRSDFAPDQGSWSTSTVKHHQIASQPEGCVHDARTNILYVGEEAAGIWAFDLGTGAEPSLVASIDNAQLVADVEGLALAPEGETGGYLVASSQGDNAYAVYSLPDVMPVGRFRIAAGPIGAAEETDGIALDTGAFGPGYSKGVFVAQDGINGSKAQNFKIVSWGEVKAALTLP